jgi:hypothetical protein
MPSSWVDVGAMIDEEPVERSNKTPVLWCDKNKDSTD